MDCGSPVDLSVYDGSPLESGSSNTNSPSGETDVDTSISEVSTSSLSPAPEIQAVKKKISKPSVLPTFLPPCRVCNAKASGFHYGVNTCEACKAFYRRSIGHEDAIKFCTSDKKCAENPKGKISCAECRLKKCVELGMARKGCRKGRYTYEKRTQDTKEFRKIQAENVLSKQIESDNCQATVQFLVDVFSHSFADIFCFINLRRLIVERVYNLVYEQSVTLPLNTLLFSPGPNSHLMEWADEFSRCINNPDTYQQGIQAILDGWFCELEKNFHGITHFAKQIPGFSDLQLDDRIILLKSARLDAIHSLRHHMGFMDLDAVAKYHMDTDDLVVIPLCLMRLTSQAKPGFIDDMKRMITRMQRLHLTDEDIAVLLAFIICMPYREGLRFPKEVEKIQDKLLPVLQYTLKKNHPDEPNVMADTLLLLPELLQNSECNRDHFQQIRPRVNTDLFPLVYEMTQDINIS